MFLNGLANLKQDAGPAVNAGLSIPPQREHVFKEESVEDVLQVISGIRDKHPEKVFLMATRDSISSGACVFEMDCNVFRNVPLSFEYTVELGLWNLIKGKSMPLQRCALHNRDKLPQQDFIQALIRDLLKWGYRVVLEDESFYIPQVPWLSEKVADNACIQWNWDNLKRHYHEMEKKYADVLFIRDPGDRDGKYWVYGGGANILKDGKSIVWTFKDENGGLQERYLIWGKAFADAVKMLKEKGYTVRVVE